MKKVKVTIKDISNSVGTVKWLEKQDIEIVIEINEKTGSPACYLIVGDYPPEIIAGVGIRYKKLTAQIEKTYNDEINDIPLFDNNRDDDKCRWFCADVPWTEAARETLETIAIYGRELFEEEVEKTLYNETPFEFATE